MSLRLDMLQVSRRATALLGETTGKVLGFLQGQFNADGGARGRGENSDLYYTIFALDGLLALGGDIPPATGAFVDSFSSGAELDLVHCACLARASAAVASAGFPTHGEEALLERITTYRSKDGGFAAGAGAECGTVYHSFLAVGAFEDLGRPLADLSGVVRCLAGCAVDGGGYANERSVPQATTPTTAAAAVLMRTFGQPIPEGLSSWLLDRCLPEGGFRAIPDAPMPDLLSTATAIHALAMSGVSLDPIREPCLDYLDSLWTGRSFRGHWADDEEDVEYTYYGLLAAGHLGEGA